jgi:hypothetical protein
LKVLPADTREQAGVQTVGWLGRNGRGSDLPCPALPPQERGSATQPSQPPSLLLLLLLLLLLFRVYSPTPLVAAAVLSQQKPVSSPKPGTQVSLSILWDTQHDSPNQSAFAGVPHTRLTRRAYATTEGAVRARFIPPWRCLLVAMGKVGRDKGRGPCSKPPGGQLPGVRTGPRFLVTRNCGLKSIATCGARALLTRSHARRNPNAIATPSQASALAEGADTLALAGAFSALRQYFQVWRPLGCRARGAGGSWHARRRRPAADPRVHARPCTAWADPTGSGGRAVG